MSSERSWASKSGGGWQQQQQQQQPQQQQSHSNNSDQSLHSNRPSQSPSATSELLYNYSAGTYPAHGTRAAPDASQIHGPGELDFQINNTILDGQVAQSTVEFPSQYFSYGNYLTPDQGSEHLFSENSSYHSPGLDDSIWQPGFDVSNGLEEYGNDVDPMNNIYHNFNQSGDLQGILPKAVPTSNIQEHLPTPGSSTNTISQNLSSSVQPSSTRTLSSPGNMDQETGKRTRTSDEANDAQSGRFSRSTSNHERPDNAGLSAGHVAKPTVLVSTYNRGDSPARTILPMARSLSKRSQSSRLSDQADTRTTPETDPAQLNPSPSGLMPPGQYDGDEWAEDDDVDEVERAGVAPTLRNADTVPSLNDKDKQQEMDETRVEVENWLATSDTGSPTNSKFDRRPPRNHIRRERRSRSTGARTDIVGMHVNNRNIPGPGALIDVDSGDDYSEADSSYDSLSDDTKPPSDSPPAEVRVTDPGKDQSYFPVPDEKGVAPEETDVVDDEPLPRQFYRRGPWQDPFQYGGTSGSRHQPSTANQAMMQYDQQAAKFETASRAATWGTRRRLSDSEISAIVDGSQMRHLSLGNKARDGKARDRGNSILNRARTVIRRSSSTVKKQHKDHAARQPSPPSDTDKASVLGNDANPPVTSPIQQVQRTFSWGKTKSPPLTSTGGALMAMTQGLTAVGSNTTSASIEPVERPKSPFLSALKRSRSKSELPKHKTTTPGLSDLFNRHGGPPMPTLASPMQMRTELTEQSHSTQIALPVDDDMDEDDDEIAVKMELPVLAHNIIPNLDGFRTHALQLNPRLPSYLVERVAQDQLRRFKKLVKNKLEHTRNVQQNGQCASENFCVELGGKPKILPPRTSAKDANVNCASFRVGVNGDSEGDEAALTDSVVTPALFPSGIPLPPATHLPAEFECPLCFQVKKFQKPSDWTKHVHEDVQPFSCTFPNCPEPKSFKRKADWVRHENERHRHLEWWRCSIQECAHVCYRKDNFVQHLVREHKMTEPKAKGPKSTGTKARANTRTAQMTGQDANTFWQLVEKCRHDTTHMPRNEPCKFCGNVCNTWKKLSVHVGKHMEQVAMPVLQLVEKRTITPETVISPIDPPNPRMSHNGMLDAAALNGQNFDGLSPYPASVVSAYHSPSIGQSPIPIQSTHVQNGTVGQISYDQSMLPGGGQLMSSGMQHFVDDHSAGQPYQYQTYEVSQPQNYASPSHGPVNFTPQQAARGITAAFHPHQPPRSQPMDSGFNGLIVDTVQGQLYNQNHGHFYPSSAPQTSFMNEFETNLGPDDGLHSPHPPHHHAHHQVARSHSPAAHVSPMANGYMYTHPQNGANGASPFYQN